MKSQNIIRLCFSTFSKPTILQSLRSYKNSTAREHLHDYIRCEKQLQKVKTQKIDYDFISKESAGVIYFREYSFQEKTEQTLVPHLNCELAPSEAWSYEQIKKELGSIEDTTKTEAQNMEIMEECQSDIEKAIRQYYTNIGKKNYQFNLQEEINKINQMTDEEYKHFAAILHGKQFVKEETTEKKTKRPYRPINHPKEPNQDVKK